MCLSKEMIRSPSTRSKQRKNRETPAIVPKLLCFTRRFLTSNICLHKNNGRYTCILGAGNTAHLSDSCFPSNVATRIFSQVVFYFLSLSLSLPPPLPLPLPPPLPPSPTSPSLAPLLLAAKQRHLFSTATPGSARLLRHMVSLWRRSKQATTESARQLALAHANAGTVDLMMGKPAVAAGHFERQLHEARTVSACRGALVGQQLSGMGNRNVEERGE